jgi:hypothetical protein
MGLKRCTLVVNGEKIRIDAKKKEVTGPEQLMSIIRKANESLRGTRLPLCASHDLPVGDLWETRSLCPLLCYLFGKESISYDETEPIERWHEGPTPPGVVY